MRRITAMMFVSILWIAPQAGMAQTVAMQAQTRAIKWLLEHQNPVGSWGDQRREVLTTAVALKALRDAGMSATQLRRAEAFLLEKRPSGNADLALAVNALRESALPLDESRMLTDPAGQPPRVFTEFPFIGRRIAA